MNRHGADGWCGLRVVTQHGTCAGIKHTDVAKRGHHWFGLINKDVGLLRGEVGV